jgi:peptide/nickel transport system substrate-binding protein
MKTDNSTPDLPPTDPITTDKTDVPVSPGYQVTTSTADSKQVVAPVAPEPSPVPTGTRRSLLLVLGLVVILGLAGVYAAVSGNRTKTGTTVPVAKKDVPVVRVATFSPLSHTYYPDVASDSTQLDINSQLFEGLTKFVNDTTLVPGLADSWTNPDSSTWVFNLHPGIKFHTGKTLTAADVKGSLEAISSSDYGKTYAATIKTVSVVNDLTVKITTDGPDPLLASELTSLLIYDTTSTKKNDAINGSGPYTVASDTPTNIKLVAFDNYHGGHVYTREVDYVGYQSLAELPSDSLKNRQVNLIAFGNNATAQSISQLTAAGYVLDKHSAYDVGHLVFNTQRKGSPFANLKVRQAVASALDITKLAQIQTTNGIDVFPATQTIAKGIPGYNPAITAPTFSSAAAKSALQAAGYPKGFAFTLTYFPSPRNKLIIPEIQSELAAVGLTVKLDPESEQKKLVQIAFGGGTDMYFGTVSSNFVDGSDILSDFINSPNYTKPALNKLNDQASQELVPAKRVNILQQMAKLIEDDQADIPLFQSNGDILAHDPAIVIHRDTLANYVGVSYWQTYAK